MTSEGGRRLAVGFSCVGHAFSHVFEPTFYVVALALPLAFDVPYEQALALIFAGKLMFGLAAPAAGWLADRWSVPGMLAIFFLGTGAASIWAGLAGSPLEMGIALTVLGLFGSIYHPVGIGWLARTAVNRGKAFGLNGAFGGFGPALGAVGAGAVIDAFGWRAAMMLPGILCMATGLLFLAALARGWIEDGEAVDRKDDPVPSRADTVRVFMVIVGVMLCGGLIYQATQASMPKLFEERLGGLFGAGTTGIGTAIAIIYAVAGALQVGAGILTDRFPLKWVYVGMYVIQVPALCLVSAAAGLPLALAMLLSVMGNIGALPAENTLMARYTPAAWRSTAYGLKFILAFGVSGLGVPLVSIMHGSAGGLGTLYLLLAGLAAMVCIALLFLPGERRAEPSGPGAAAPVVVGPAVDPATGRAPQPAE